MINNQYRARSGLCLFSLISILAVNPFPVFAQGALEEVVVTAQRREQNLQDVPISILTISGAEIKQQGFADLEDVAAFSPGVYIQSGTLDQRITVRGFGTIGNSGHLEQAVPIFVDGVHFGRQSQIFTSFLDVERVEILKGPQPVYFGMNATAGAFNIQSKKPTPEWEGDVDLALGNNNSKSLSFGVGGPLTNTLGIRLAGMYDHTDGYLRHLHVDEKGPHRGGMGGRVTLQWTPNDKLQVTTKFDAHRARNGSEPYIGCVTEGSMIWGRARPTTPGTVGNQWSINAEPPQGSGFNAPLLPLNDSRDGGNCLANNDVYMGNSASYLQAPDNIREQEMDRGSLDIREAGHYYITAANTGEIFGETGLGLKTGRKPFDDIDSFAGAVNVNYKLDNQIQFDAIASFNKFDRRSVRDDSNSPFFFNHQSRQENFDQWSAEARFSSPVGGKIEWMTGAHYQTMTNDHMHNTLRPNLRQGQRMNNSWEDSSWLNGFAIGTLNFLEDNQLSVDAGVRVSRVKKEAQLIGYTGTWIYDVQPTHPAAYRVNPADAKIYVPGPVNLNNLWSVPFLNGTRSAPEWLPSRSHAVGLTYLNRFTRPGASGNDSGFYDKQTNTYYDPQVTLRYKVGQNHSIFARWAQATKGPGYDVGPGALPADLSEFVLGREKGTTFEFGSKGDLWEGRARYDVTFFRTDFADLQGSGLAPVTQSDQTSVAISAGKQRVQGVEMGLTAAVTDRLTLGMNGAILDGEMREFAGSGCNFQEFQNALLGRGIPVLEGCDVATSKIDRSGSEAPRTPDWSFVLNARYVMPILDQYQAVFNAKGFISDGYITDRSGFSRMIKFDKHGDLNLQVGFGDMHETWQVYAYANSIFEHSETYYPELDVVPQGTINVGVSNSQYRTYGLKFSYNFR